ncbi:glucuronate isomerase [Flavicella sp.]|uniref:glucuronate isomerase n=1 Tax=Flavicella sp. TaxID=2957742 RepID=UPI00263262C9|nr:glucuronate isomerase [Flavicella sp.]MDG1804257.1 glucuronate isomerase [Flavicella sp.]
MEFKKSIRFDVENLFLNSETAKKLYFEHAAKMPIIDYHNHLSAKDIAENKPVNNITDAWLASDHYKWRAMRANGVQEEFVTGDVEKLEKFEKWAETVPYTVGNPLFHWNQLELKRYFDIDEVLQPSNARSIYDKCNNVLEKMTPASLLEHMKVELVCTTDDPADSLEHHIYIAKGDFYTTVLPTFRSDNLFFIETNGFQEYLNKLETAADIIIDDLDSLLEAITRRIEFFDEVGCKISDYGITGALVVEETTKEEVKSIFYKFLNKENLSDIEVAKYRTYILLFLAKKYYEKDWVQQYHLGVIRNNNKRLTELFGADAGCDSMGDYSMAEQLSKFLNKLDYENTLTKTIAYNLNPAYDEVFATMMGNFASSGVPGKMQWGAAWWFLDQKEGIEKNLRTLSSLGLLSRSLGMLTDSRSFLSFPRHEYFRRILCNLIGDQIEKGELPDDLSFFGKLIEDVSCNNTKDYFGF